MTTITLPKAAEQFVADAKAQGYEVIVDNAGGILSVQVRSTSGKRHGEAVWQITHVAANSRLGFATSAGTASLRFLYANSHSYGRNYGSRSLAAHRRSLGL